jgi:hypothetical protein
LNNLVSADQLTGALVRQFRDSRKITRKTFSEMCGFKSSARLVGIETRESWRDGDRERVMSVLTTLEQDEASSSTNATDIASPPPSSNGTSSNGVHAAIEAVDFDFDGLWDDVQPVYLSVSDTNGGPATISASWMDELQTASWNNTTQSDPWENDVQTSWGDRSQPTWPDETQQAAPTQQITPTQQVAPAQQIQQVAPTQQTVTIPPPDLSGLNAPEGTLILTNSEFITKNRCDRKWWLTYYRRLQLKAKDYSGPRSIGDRIHRAFAMWYVPADSAHPQVDPITALEQVIAADWTVLAEQAREAGADDTELADLATKFSKATELERIMVEGYVQWIIETGVDSDYRVLGSEQVIYWDTEIPNIHTDEQNPNIPGHAIRVLGKIDTQLERVSDGVRMQLDHKTSADMKTLQKTLHGNSQSLTYLMLEWLNTPEGEKRSDTILWNMLKKVKRTATAKPPFYERTEIRYNIHELEAHKRELLAVAREIIRTKEALDAGASYHDVAPKNWKAECSWDCDFLPICPLFDDGSRVEDAISGLYQVVDPLARYAEEIT